MENACTSLAEECQKLCSNHQHVHGAKGSLKHGKKERKARVKEYFYHIQNPEDIQGSDLKFTASGLE